MKINIMTCQHVYNYGATLQAYALQTYLEKLGNNVKVIDYRLPTHLRYELFSIYPQGRLYPLLRRFPILRYVLCPIRNRVMLYTWGRKKTFDKFDERYLHLTRTFKTIEELQQNPPYADLYIAGSDQIWNPRYPNGRDLGYYLDFGDSKSKRVSYAASFGVSDIDVEQQAFVLEHLKRFDLVSVREASGVEILNKLGIKSELCVDPVFLLDRKEWIENLDLQYDGGEYILLYDFTDKANEIKEYALNLSKAKGLKIIAVNDTLKTPYADIQINNAGPIEFLKYIINSRYVISNSFHATAFSILLHKKFVTFSLKSENNTSRMENILNMAGLSDRLNPSPNFDIDSDISWHSVDQNMKMQTEHSKEFLDKAIKLV